MTESFNPFEHPVCFSYPARIATSHWTAHVPFGMYLVDLLKPKIFVELGTFNGVSYCAFCQAVKQLQLDTRCYAVDTWKGDAHNGFYGHEVLDDLRKHHDLLYSGFSTLIQSTFDDAVGFFTDGSIDLLHIDGYHTYDAVKHDFETWLPKVSRDGVVILHDINTRMRDYAVWQFWDELKAEGNYPYFELFHEYGLGVLCVGENAPVKLQCLLNLSSQDSSILREFFFNLGTRIELHAALNTSTSELAGLQQQILNQSSALQSVTEEAAKREEYAHSLEGTLEQRDAELAQYRQAVTALNAQITDLQTQFESHEQLNELRRELERLHQEVAARDTALLGSHNHLDELRIEVEQLHAEIASRDAAVTEYRAELGVLYAEVTNRDNVLLESNAQQSRLQAELDRLHAAIAVKDSELIDLGTQLTSLQPELNRLHAEVAQRDLTIASYQSELTAVQTDLDHLTSESAIERATLRDSQSQLVELQGAVESLQIEVLNRDAQIERLQTEIEQQDGTITSYESQIANLNQELERQRRGFQALDQERVAQQRHLERLSHDFTEVSQSFMMRAFVMPLWNFRRKWLPDGSLGYAAYRAIRGFAGKAFTHKQSTPKARRASNTEPQGPPTLTLPDRPPPVAHGPQVRTVIICTIISKNYVAYARALIQSIREFHDDVHLVTLLVDELDDYYDPAAELFETVLAADLNIPRWHHFSLKYSVMELNTAVKPYFLEYLFERDNAQKIIYFDPDIILYHRLDELLTLLDQYTAVLIPHLLDALGDDRKPNELDILRAGAYNLGFIAISRTHQWHSLLHWWQEKLYDYCTVEFERGLFVDQRWMDLAPSLFENVYILRNPGYNVAYWNFKRRDLQATADGFQVNGQPLIFFHYSGFAVDDLEKVSRHQDRFTLSDLNHTYRAFFEDYRQRLLSHGYQETRHWPYAYGTFDNGVPVSEFARMCLREADLHGDRWPNPFNVSGTDTFWHWLIHPSVEPAAQYVSPYALTLRSRRVDLKGAFPEPLGKDEEAFARWFVDNERDEEGPPEIYHLAYIAPVKAALYGTASPVPGTAQALSAPSPAATRLYRPQHTRAALTPGVNLIGYAHSETGVGQQARNMIDALTAGKIPTAVLPIEGDDVARKLDKAAVSKLTQGTPHMVNVFHVNADMTFAVQKLLDPSVYQDHYNIAFWSWELCNFPKRWLSCFDVYDEIWVASTFVQATLAEATSKPITCIPNAIQREFPDNSRREDFGLPEDCFIVLFIFDALSIIERKNPWAAIEAFEKAFSPAERHEKVRLVIKATNLQHFPSEAARLRAEMRRINGILIEHYLDRVQVDALLMHCDVYLSLHRSEGYGLTLAEAMYFEKPVVGTGYSGNVDFMKPGNSYLVPYSLVELEQDYPPYEAGNVWAAADTSAAADFLAHIYRYPDEAREQARRGAAYIREHNNQSVLGKLLALQLGYIQERFNQR